jgi:hypothetical protein
VSIKKKPFEDTAYLFNDKIYFPENFTLVRLTQSQDSKNFTRRHCVVAQKISLSHSVTKGFWFAPLPPSNLPLSFKHFAYWKSHTSSEFPN